MKKTLLNEKSTKTKTITLRSSLAELVEKKAVEDNRTFSNMVETLLIKSVQHYEAAI